METAGVLELITSNPANGAYKQIAEPSKRREKDIEVFTAEQVENILTTCKKYYRRYYPFFLFAFRTGMRLGELLGLNWSDINWQDNFIRVQRSYKNTTIIPTKNKLNRKIELSPLLKETLHLLFMGEKKRHYGKVEHYRSRCL